MVQLFEFKLIDRGLPAFSKSALAHALCINKGYLKQLLFCDCTCSRNWTSFVNRDPEVAAKQIWKTSNFRAFAHLINVPQNWLFMKIEFWIVSVLSSFAPYQVFRNCVCRFYSLVDRPITEPIVNVQNWYLPIEALNIFRATVLF